MIEFQMDKIIVMLICTVCGKLHHCTNDDRRRHMVTMKLCVMESRPLVDNAGDSFLQVLHSANDNAVTWLTDVALKALGNNF